MLQTLGNMFILSISMLMGKIFIVHSCSYILCLQFIVRMWCTYCNSIIMNTPIISVKIKSISVLIMQSEKEAARSSQPKPS